MTSPRTSDGSEATKTGDSGMQIKTNPHTARERLEALLGQMRANINGKGSYIVGVAHEDAEALREILTQPSVGREEIARVYMQIKGGGTVQPGDLKDADTYLQVAALLSPGAPEVNTTASSCSETGENRTSAPGAPALPAQPTETQITHMVDRFLGWRLPENFNPDGGVTFTKIGNPGTAHEYMHVPVGTNLFDAEQAGQMVRHMLEGLPAAPGAPEGWREALTDQAVETAMQDAWDEWVAASGEFPGDFKITRGPKLWFTAGDFARSVAMYLRSAITPPSSKEQDFRSSRDHAPAIGSALDWQPISTAPRDGTTLRVRYANGDEDTACWEESRTCMLGRLPGCGGAGQVGPGWVSTEAEYLPIDEPDFWLPALSSAKQVASESSRDAKQPSPAPSSKGEGPEWCMDCGVPPGVKHHAGCTTPTNREGEDDKAGLSAEYEINFQDSLSEDGGASTTTHSTGADR